MEPREPEPLSGTWNLLWNLLVEPLWNVEPLKFGEPEPLYMQRCGTWNLLSVELCGNWDRLRVEPLCGTLGNLVPGFPPLPQTMPKLCWQDQVFQTVGEKSTNHLGFEVGVTSCLVSGPVSFRHDSASNSIGFKLLLGILQYCVQTMFALQCRFMTHYTHEHTRKRCTYTILIYI